MYSTREEVESWLCRMGVENYVINEDLTVDVNDDVDISCKNLKTIPIQFGIVNGVFNCGCNNLTSLKNCPPIVKNRFHCSQNELTNFEDFPKEINGDFIFMHDNKIKEEELVNFNCNIENVKNIYSDFNTTGDKEGFLNKVNYYKIKKENELLKELSIHSNNMKLNKKL